MRAKIPKLVQRGHSIFKVLYHQWRRVYRLQRTDRLWQQTEQAAVQVLTGACLTR